ncbi:PAS domain-containing protein [Frigidibacter sp. MR17.14]|uniref:PAS domain-containing protein n=1 Tax=Frigidibacter sp. MR17.14 TaxID=3126509 RepID=UPI003012D239
MIENVRSYWRSLCGDRPVPARSEVDPRALQGALDNAFILERIAPSVARFRVAGAHLTDLIGMEVRGMPLTALFAPRARQQVTMRLEEAFSRPAILDLTLAAETGFGKPEMTGHLMVLPLASDLGDVSRALGVFWSEGTIGRTPRRFEVTSERLTLCQGDATLSTGQYTSVPGFSEPRFDFLAALGSNRKREPAPETMVEPAPLLPATPEERRAMFRVVGSD